MGLSWPLPAPYGTGGFVMGVKPSTAAEAVQPQAWISAAASATERTSLVSASKDSVLPCPMGSQQSIGQRIFERLVMPRGSIIVSHRYNFVLTNTPRQTT